MGPVALTAMLLTSFAGDEPAAHVEPVEPAAARPFDVPSLRRWQGTNVAVFTRDGPITGVLSFVAADRIVVTTFDGTVTLLPADVVRVSSLSATPQRTYRPGSAEELRIADELERSAARDAGRAVSATVGAVLGGALSGLVIAMAFVVPGAGLAGVAGLAGAGIVAWWSVAAYTWFGDAAEKRRRACDLRRSVADVADDIE